MSAYNESKTKEQISDTLCDITSKHEITIDSCITSLEMIRKTKKISETNLKSLINVFRELDSLREVFFLRLLNSAKRGNMIV